MVDDEKKSRIIFDGYGRAIVEKMPRKMFFQKLLMERYIIPSQKYTNFRVGASFQKVNFFFD